MKKKYQLVIKNLNEKVISAEEEKSILKNIHADGTDWLFMCGGKGRCTTCKIIVHEGEENLSPLTESEKKYRTFGRLATHERLACQVFAKGNAVFSCEKENKLPHLSYSDEKAD